MILAPFGGSFSKPLAIINLQFIRKQEFSELDLKRLIPQLPNLA